MLGSHNTMTYLPVRKWWMKALKSTAKCQYNSLEEQYNKGARAFDFRIKCKDGVSCFSHGLVDYKSEYIPIVTIYKFLQDHKDVEIEIVAEDTMTRNFDYVTFNETCVYLQKEFPEINIIKVFKEGWRMFGGFTKGCQKDYYEYKVKDIVPKPNSYKSKYGLEEAINNINIIWKDFI